MSSIRIRTCGSCRYALYGECHLHPPSVVVVKDDFDQTERVESHRPVVRWRDLACAGYQRRAETSLQVSEQIDALVRLASYDGPPR